MSSLVPELDRSLKKDGSSLYFSVPLAQELEYKDSYSLSFIFYGHKFTYLRRLLSFNAMHPVARAPYRLLPAPPKELTREFHDNRGSFFCVGFLCKQPVADCVPSLSDA